MMRTIHLYGELGRRFGRVHRFDVASPAEATRAMCLQLKGFQEVLAEGRYRVVAGHPNRGLHYTEETLRLGMGRHADLHVVPVLAGAGGKAGAIGMIIVGVALIATAFLAGPAIIGALGLTGTLLGTALPNIALSLGAGLALQGVSALLAPKPKVQGSQPETEKQRSYLFGGSSIEGVVQGRPVPLVFGTIRHKLQPISFGMYAEDLPPQ